MKPIQLRVHNMLVDTIRLLCKNSLPFSESLRIEGVIGITTDSSDVFIVHVNETLATETSSTIVNRETSHEPSFGGMAAPVKRSHTVSAAPVSQPSQNKYHKDMPSPKTSDFSHERNAGKSSSNSEDNFDMPILQKVDISGRTYESENSNEITSPLVPQSFIHVTNDGLQNGEGNYEESGQDEFVEQLDYKTGEEQESWNTDYGSQRQNENHQETWMTPPKLPIVGRTKQGIRGGGRGRGKVAQVRPVKSVDNMGERNPMSSSGEPNQYVITQSTHVCGYPDCTKKFSRKDTLVRHQVKVHGRDPVKRGTPKKHCFGAGMEADYGNEGVDDSYGYEVYQ